MFEAVTQDGAGHRSHSRSAALLAGEAAAARAKVVVLGARWRAPGPCGLSTGLLNRNDWSCLTPRPVHAVGVEKANVVRERLGPPVGAPERARSERQVFLVTEGLGCAVVIGCVVEAPPLRFAHETDEPVHDLVIQSDDVEVAMLVEDLQRRRRRERGQRRPA